MPAASTVTLVLVAVLVVAVAAYLVAIIVLLRRASFTLGTVLVGVRAIAHATTPVEAVVDGIGEDVIAIESALRGLRPPHEDERAAG